MDFSFGTAWSPAGRRSPNWFAMACGAAYLLCYLFLPFYSVYIHRMPGTEVISCNSLMLLPAALGLAMALSAVLLPAVVSLAISGVSFMLTLIFALAGQQIIPYMQLVNSGMSFLGSTTGMQEPMPAVSVSVGYGAILCLTLVIAHFVLELLLGGRHTAPPARNDQGSWAFKNKPTSGPGGPYKPF